MKLSSKQYAEGLYESLQGKNQKEIDFCVLNFLNLVKKNKRRKDIGRIMANFQEIFNEKESVLPVEIETFGKVQEETNKKIGEFLEKQYPGKKIELSQKMNPEILGGIIIKAGDDLWDMSVVRKVRRLKAQIAK